MDHQALVSGGLDQISKASSLSSLENVRVGLLGKNGQVSRQLSNLGQLPKQARKQAGQELNKAKNILQAAIHERREVLETVELTARLANETVDVSLPPLSGSIANGRIHPISQVTQELSTIFALMGFEIAEGPDIETDYYNFTGLNFPQGHPAREMHDTFFLQPDELGEQRLLRTHTSPVQVRTMESQKPPIRIIIPGRTYRCDNDATHTPMFHQVEGLVVDESANIGNLKWVLESFCKAFFEVDEIKMRFRPSFFPFTEPSMEVDIGCDRSGGKISIGVGEDWLEVLGCGMVHPNVLRINGLDPDVYQGFAWGMGIDRLAMLKYGIPDLRDMFTADVRWLDHYGFHAMDIPGVLSGLSR